MVNSLLQSWLGIVFNYVASLSEYEVVEGVDFFSLLIAIGVFSIVVRYLFTKIQGAG